MSNELLSSWVFWAVIGFLSGSVPYAIVVGAVFLRKDIRKFGDANPGATNVMRAGGGPFLMLLAGVLDGLKAMIPVALARNFYGVTGLPLVIVALAPVVGHAFSIFLGFRGGKAIAATFGALCALTVWEGPVMFGLLLLVWVKMIRVSGWVVMFTLFSLGVYFFLANRDGIVLGTLLGLMALLAITHRSDLRQPPGFNAGFKARVDKLPIWRARRSSA
jgi:glycerol-3-phosphate acyltransferase PlsY